MSKKREEFLFSCFQKGTNIIIKVPNVDKYEKFLTLSQVPDKFKKYIYKEDDMFAYLGNQNFVKELTDLYAKITVEQFVEHVLQESEKNDYIELDMPGYIIYYHGIMNGRYNPNYDEEKENLTKYVEKRLGY